MIVGNVLKKSLHLILLLGISTVINIPSKSYAEIVVIVNPKNPTDSISEKRLKNIFMGKIKTFPNDQEAIPVDLASGSSRKEFRKNLLKKSDGQLEAYWARAMFSNIAAPPKEVDSEKKIRELVAANPKLIAYIDSALLDPSVKVVKVEKERSMME